MPLYEDNDCEVETEENITLIDASFNHSCSCMAVSCWFSSWDVVRAVAILNNNQFLFYFFLYRYIIQRQRFYTIK
jgi:hypothetical protein